ncbi:MAG: hypothetical protein CMI32_06920, partial [Opitutales bacterium]|nr:hypothetical protein [Opitutales bacterium]
LPDDTPGGDDLSSQFSGLSILEDRSLSDGLLPTNSVISKAEAHGNSFYAAVENVYLEVSMEEDGSPNNEDFNLLTGREVLLGAGTYDLGDVYGSDNELFVFTAHDSLTMSGDLAFKVSDESVDSAESMIGFLSAGTLQIVEGSTVKFAGAEIGLASADTMQIGPATASDDNTISVSLEADSEIGLRSLEDLVINNSELRTRGIKGGLDEIHLLAYNELAIDGLKFSSAVRQIHMEAMTINLRNVMFPGGSTVSLKSLYGPLDGKYPTFGTENQKMGRVNFLKNVQYNQQLLNSRAAFDLHGGNVHILGK